MTRGRQIPDRAAPPSGNETILGYLVKGFFLIVGLAIGTWIAWHWLAAQHSH